MLDSSNAKEVLTSKRVEKIIFPNHRYAVVVQDLATQWIQSYPCKTKTSHETEKIIKNLGTVAQTESCIQGQLDGIWEACEELS